MFRLPGAIFRGLQFPYEHLLNISHLNKDARYSDQDGLLWVLFSKQTNSNPGMCPINSLTPEFSFKF
jgi:hypothetical protein